jgi:hypothetical protein
MKSKNCPYCGGKNIYLKRTWPMEQNGCRDCESEIEYLRECGMGESQIRTMFEKKKKRREG